MGLASYGKELLPNCVPNYKDLSFTLKYGDLLDEFYAKELCSGKDHFSFVSAEGKDLAYTIQRFTEDALVSLVKNLAKKYGIYKFCLSGGVFLNCLSNHKILEKADIEDVRIFPAAGDDGQAIGCALHVFVTEHAICVNSLSSGNSPKPLHTTD